MKKANIILIFSALLIQYAQYFVVQENPTYIPTKEDILFYRILMLYHTLLYAVIVVLAEIAESKWGVRIGRIFLTLSIIDFIDEITGRNLQMYNGDLFCLIGGWLYLAYEWVVENPIEIKLYINKLFNKIKQTK